MRNPIQRFIKKSCVLFSLLLFITFIPFGCNKGNFVLNLSFFNTNVHIESYGYPISDKAENEIKKVLKEIDDSVSVLNENSVISKFNSSAFGTPVSLDFISSAIIKRSFELFDITNSKFNICVYPLTRLWNLSADTFNNGLRTFNLPSDNDINETKLLTSLKEKVIYNEFEKTLTKTEDNVMIDLGGIAKGYAVDRVKKILSSNGIYDGYVSIGSSSMYLFNVDEISIRHPRRTKDLSTILTVKNGLKNKFVSTSGDYERFFEKNGKRYCHVIDANTGYPTDTGIISATVFGNSGTDTDAISTSLMLFSYDENNHENSELIKFINSLLSVESSLKFYVVYSKTSNILLTNDTANIILHDQNFKIKAI